jgi:hypothetical protein
MQKIRYQVSRLVQFRFLCYLSISSAAHGIRSLAFLHQQLRYPLHVQVLSSTRDSAHINLEARRVAHSVLTNPNVGGRSTEGTLPNHPAFHHLSQRDRSFAKLLVATTERRQGQIDSVLKMCAQIVRMTNKQRTITF